MGGEAGGKGGREEGKTGEGKQSTPVSRRASDQ